MPGIAIMGLDNAGKTSLCDFAFIGKTAEEVMKDSSPTLGASPLNFSYLNFSIKLMDLGGQTQFRKLWVSPEQGYLYRDHIQNSLLHLLCN